MIYFLFLLVAAGMAAASPAVAQQPPSPEYLAAQTIAAASWPHTTQRDGATVTVYQPQAIAWPERRTLTARTAVAIVRPGQTKPLLGTIELTLATRVDEAQGVVYLANPVLLATHFPVARHRASRCAGGEDPSRNYANRYQRGAAGGGAPESQAVAGGIGRGEQRSADHFLCRSTRELGRVRRRAGSDSDRRAGTCPSR